MTPIFRQSGVALITALLIVSIAVILATSLVDHMFLDIRRTENLMRSDQVYSQAISSEEFTRILLLIDASTNEYDDNVQIDQANTALIRNLAGGVLVGEIQDLQGRFNLNNLSEKNNDRALARAQFQKLLSTQGLDPNLVFAVEDWIDEDQQVNNPPHGAEFDYYIGLEVPYRSADQLMSSASELRLVKGFNKSEIYDAIIPYVCALPSFTSININTSSAEVLESLADIESTDVQQIILRRDGPPADDPSGSSSSAGESFETINTFENYMRNNLNKKNYTAAGLTVSSNYFLLKTTIAYEENDASYRFYAIMNRDSGGAAKVISRSQGVW